MRANVLILLVVLIKGKKKKKSLLTLKKVMNGAEEQSDFHSLFIYQVKVQAFTLFGLIKSLGTLFSLFSKKKKTNSIKETKSKYCMPHLCVLSWC